MNMRTKTFLLSALFVMTILACGGGNINISTGPDLALTITAQAFLIQLTSQSQSQPQPQPQSQPQSQPVVVFTDTPQPTATPQKPMVNKTTLCWRGPGGKYEVVSALNQGQAVDLIGRGSISGWFIIDNPRYHDPCWVQASDLQIDASFDINTLQIIVPPAIPTNTPKPTKVPTPTP